MIVRPVKKKAVIAASVAGVIVLALAVVWLVEYAQHQRWLLEDAHTLQPYQIVLMDNGKDWPGGNPGAPDANHNRLAEMAQIIRDHIQGQNILLSHLSMSEPRQNLWRDRSYVKVYIVTQVAGLPPGEDRTRRVKAVYTLARNAKGWRLVSSMDRTIE